MVWATAKIAPLSSALEIWQPVPTGRCETTRAFCVAVRFCSAMSALLLVSIPDILNPYEIIFDFTGPSCHKCRENASYPASGRARFSPSGRGR